MTELFTTLNQLFSQWNDSMSNLLMFLLLLAGLYFSFQLRFPQIVHFPRALRIVFGDLFKREKNAQTGSMSSFQALATAIAAQVGTGNVAGVATALIAGGPGAIFWMWVSAFFGMSTIFVEAVLGQVFRQRINDEYVGGPAYYLSQGLSIAYRDPTQSSGSDLTGEPDPTPTKLNQWLAGFFSIALILALGFIGNAVQSNSIAIAVAQAFPVSKLVVGIVIACLAAFVFWGGMSRIASFAELVVPIMAFFYLVGSVIIMLMFRDQLAPAFSLIVRSAFAPQAALGGMVGASVKEAMKRGVARGLFSNEAGMGSTPHAHAVANVNHPAEQGLTAMVGVFIDTGLVCTATALVILVTQSYKDPSLQGALLTQQAFTHAFGTWGTVFLAVCLSFFAFTTLIGWYYFGEANVKYLFKGKGLTIYRLLVCGFIILGATLEVDFVWTMADVFNTLMVFPNILGLLLLAPLAKKTLESYSQYLASKE